MQASTLQRWGLAALLLAAAACGDPGKKSAAEARAHVEFVSAAARQDVGQVREGLPLGAALLSSLFASSAPEVPGAEASKQALDRTRDKVQNLRVAKSTFFALLSPEGRVIRNDREQDLMVGKEFFGSFPALAQLGDKTYLETRGSMPEASGVKGRADAQWVADAAIRQGERLVGHYVTGWSWSSYAYRLETGLRSNLLASAKEGDKIPLLYVFVAVEKDIYGTPVSPAVSRDAVAALGLVARLEPGKVHDHQLTIDGRSFGLAARLVSELGDKVALVVLRSET